MFLTRIKVATAMLLLVGALGIGVSGLPHGTIAAEPPSSVSKSPVPRQDQGNLKETVLALEKRIWEAHTTQNLDAVKGLLADDYVETDTRGRNETKASNLDWMANFRVVDPVMKNAKVVVLNATSTLVTYEIRYKIASPAGQLLETVPPRQVTSAWAQRDGKWWCVYAEASVLGNVGTRWKATTTDERWKAADTWETTASFRLSDTKLGAATDKEAKRLRVYLPPPPDTDGKVAEPLSVQLARINAANTTYTIEETIPIVKQYIELDVKKLNEAKDAKSTREALEGMERSVRLMKELLAVGVPAKTKP